MGLKILVVEDNEELYQYFLRIFENLLPVEKFEFVNAGTIAAALEMLDQDWDAILMDYSLGESAQDGDGGITLRNGADLISHRRALEAMATQEGANQSCPKCRIIAASNSNVFNAHMVEAGADKANLKIEVPEIAERLRGLEKETT